MNIDEIYNKLITDESILTLTQLSKLFSFGSKKRLKMNEMLYNKYGKEHIMSIVRQRLSKHAASISWKSRSRTMPEDVKEKIRQSNKNTWQNDTGERRQKAKKLMVENAKKVDRKVVTKKAIETRRKRDKWAEYSKEGKQNLIRSLKTRTLSKLTREKMSKSAKSRGFCRKDGWSYPEDAKKLVSKKIGDLWKSGKYKKIYQSKICNELINELILLGYDVETEFFVGGRPYDIKVKNTIIEFNGTYWHLDPRKYPKDFYDKSRKIFSNEVWEKDAEKKQIAEAAGYNVFVVWQSDWENDKNGVLENVRRFIN